VPRIGETLREARLRRQIDIADVEQATKIRAKYLRALENEEFDLLPGPTFVRSFLKTYANYLGLDARVLVEEYRAHHEEAPEEEPAAALATGRPPRQRELPRYERRPPPTGLIVAGGVAALLLLFLILGLTGGEERRPPEERDGAEQAADRDERRERAERRERRRRSTPRRVSLRIGPQGPTYVCIDRGPGQETIFEGSLASARTFRGRRLRMNLGRPSARVTVNGRRVNLGTTVAAVGFDFRPGRRPRPLPLGERPCT
jgi:cytoskeleton protein RodZ